MCFQQTCGKEPTDTFNAFKLGKAVDGNKVKALVFYIKDKKEIVLEKTLGTKGGCEDAKTIIYAYHRAERDDERYSVDQLMYPTYVP